MVWGWQDSIPSLRWIVLTLATRSHWETFVESNALSQVIILRKLAEIWTFIESLLVERPVVRPTVTSSRVESLLEQRAVMNLALVPLIKHEITCSRRLHVRILRAPSATCTVQSLVGLWFISRRYCLIFLVRDDVIGPYLIILCNLAAWMGGLETIADVDFDVGCDAHFRLNLVVHHVDRVRLLWTWIPRVDSLLLDLFMHLYLFF